MLFSRFTVVVALIAAALIAVFVLNGCEEITKAATINVPITVKLHPESINPSIPTVDTDCYDLTTNSDYNDNKDMVEDGVLKSASYQIIQLENPSFDPNTAIFSIVTFTLDFDASYGDTKIYQLGTFTNVKVSDLQAGKMNIPLNADVQDAIHKIAGGWAKFCVHASYGPLTTGAGSATAMKGELEMTIDFSVTPL